MTALVHADFDPSTGTVSYVVHEGPGSACAIVDPVLDYDPKSGRTSTASADRLVAFVQGQGLHVEWILETHAHADHLTATAYLKGRLGGRTAIGERIATVQGVFKSLFNLEPGFRPDGSQFDRLLADGDELRVGRLVGQVLHVPGHTPADVAYRFGDAVFVGDTLFMPDYGTARCDFPGGDARTLYQSIQKLFALPGDTRVFMCHDYKAPGREEFLHETTIAAESEYNVHVHAGISEDQFVAMRTARDATLGMPTLILPSVQINMRGGELPEPESNGTRYLKIPLDVL